VGFSFASIIRCSWALIVLFVIWGVYSTGIAKKEREINKLSAMLATIESDKIGALEEQEQLKLEKESWADPAWVELVLCRKLGLVPAGHTKVHFIHP